MKKLILIRHAETDYTLQKRYCGHENIMLNKKGIKEAHRLQERLKNIKVDSIYSSDLKRAFQTAKIAFKNRKIFKRIALREIDFGRLCGLTPKEAKKLYPDVHGIWLNNPTSIKMPGGEDLHDFTKRVTRCFRDIFNKNRRKVVAIVSHGGPIRIILLKILNLSLDKFWTIEQDPAAINIIEFKYGVPKVKAMNKKI